MRVPILKRISVRCLNKSSSFYNAGSNSSKGLTSKEEKSFGFCVFVYILCVFVYVLCVFVYVFLGSQS